MSLKFQITARSARTRARTGVVSTPHGVFDTPAFMPVGTRATVRGLFPGMVARSGAQIILGNTYHLMLRPGGEVVERLGGLHRFSGWTGPMLTDSGGYQAYSMAGINRITETGVTFKSIIDGRDVELTPELAILVQNQLGADIIMAFDDCPPSVDPDAGPVNQTRLRLAAARDAAEAQRTSSRPALRGKRGYDHQARLQLANERTVRWLGRCKAEHARLEGDRVRALFGIVQGGTDLAQREWSAERICNIELPGYAIGGVAVGEQSDQIARVVVHTAPLLPEDKPRYLMGVGYERDLLAAVRAGVDMFDCVLPTRNGRNANAFTSRGQIRLRNAQFGEDSGPLEQGCDCPACQPAGLIGNSWASSSDLPFSRAYIRHLFLAKEMLGPILVSLHNLRHFQRFMSDLRRTVQTDDWDGLLARWPVAHPDNQTASTA
ncbi:MAG: tRNA guanosine(34) transglycosylase Tgt [Phycisphaerales bacterium]|nr:tRNA guanosine(34) transglycosylase Tgt [Phycisphaerales bacterium]